MRIDELLYFAPGVTFAEVDFGGDNLPEQFEKRLRGFYIEPAFECASAGHGFAAGVLLLVCIDALARMQTGNNRVGDRYVAFVRQELPSFSDPALATRLYNTFRNGLIHEGRIKAGAQFTFDTDATVDELQGVMVVNPAKLAQELSDALDRYVSDLQNDKAKRQHLADLLQADHADDV